MTDEELREQIEQISNKFVLDVYENTRNGRNSIRAGVRMNDALMQLIKARDAAVRIDELSMLGRLPLNNNQLEKVVHRIDMLKKEFRTSDLVRSKDKEDA